MADHEAQQPAAEKDDFARQAEAMNAPPPPKFVMGLRSIVYGVLVFLLFGLDFLQTYGNLFHPENYPSPMYMRTINLNVFNSIFTLLIALCSVVFPLLFTAFLLFASCVMWATAGGILVTRTPFTAGSCNADNANWERFVDDCNMYVANYALSWTLFALTLILLVAIVADVFMTKHKRHYLLGQ
ncbi:hypothetical protein Rhopal_000575-T1 [Rhodotorula paludigena]|uniref:MARVEL domain-containing protein n=1 Tax=Rhodotorula paludigena TaxID=86838 RepID=A0AAV5G5F7_9BASI|nr:hypothetical protein Rhopal_000575-T1 [Rhodotorula paludigena]